MSVLQQNESWKILTGDSLALLRTFPADTFHCCVTSPPYFGLRDYGTGKWEGGNDPGCDHVERTAEEVGRANTLGPQGYLPVTNAAFKARSTQYKHTCGKCGAIRVDQQIGLEKTPALFVARLVEVFSEVKRVLRPDGCMFLNVGDSYSGGKMGRSDKQDGGGLYKGLQNGWDKQAVKQNDVPLGLKPKDLLGMPWRLAFALQESGWYLRSEIIWSKVAPMPESVRDRPTKSHEQIFLLTLSPKYFYDQDADRPKATPAARLVTGKCGSYGQAIASGRKPSGNGIPGSVMETGDSRNLWTVWDDLRPEPFPAAHFATFPPDLPARCIRLGTSAHGVCRACGAPWVRVVARKTGDKESTGRPKGKGHGGYGSSSSTLSLSGNGSREWAERGSKRETLGWEPSCDCEAAEPIGALVLDPFCGAATTGLVARRLGRRFVGIELNPEYAEMGRKRIAEDAPMFNATTSATSAPEPSLFDTLEEEPRVRPSGLTGGAYSPPGQTPHSNARVPKEDQP